MLDYSIKKISEIEEKDLYNFYKIVFKDKYKTLIKHYKWWYKIGSTNCEPIIITLKNRIVGQLATQPTKINFQQNVLSGCWFIDFAVLPEFQGKGAGSILVQEATKLSEIQLAFCNKAALKVYSKLGWNINKETRRIVRPINPAKWLPIVKNMKTKFFSNFYNNFLNNRLQIKDNIKPLDLSINFKQLSENFLKRKIKSSNTLFEFTRDKAWFDWRFYEFPLKKNLKFFEYKGNYVIVHEIILDNVKRLHFIFHFYLELCLEEELYRLITKWAIDNDYDLVWTCSANHTLIKNLKDVMPSVFLKKITIASYSSNKNIFKGLNSGFKNIQASDSDMDIVFKVVD